MKKCIAAILLLTGLTVSAQDRQGPPQGGPGKDRPTTEEQVKTLTKELNLDSKQQAKVKELYAAQEKKRGASKPDGNQKGEKPNREEMEAKMKAEQTDFDSKIKKILTEEQYTKYKASEKNKQGGKKGEGPKKS
jgi:Spy/CpxP family protein refolding chaperone